jgi:hypothetical protein
MMSKVTASTDGPERFSPLMCRFESVLHRLKLAAEDLRDLAEEVPIVDQVPPPLLWERRRGIWNSFTTISGRPSDRSSRARLRRLQTSRRPFGGGLYLEC